MLPKLRNILIHSCLSGLFELSTIEEEHVWSPMFERIFQQRLKHVELFLGSTNLPIDCCLHRNRSLTIRHIYEYRDKLDR